MDQTTFTLREVLGCAVTDEFGTWQGQLADVSVRPTPEGREPVDLVLRDGYGEFVIPRPEALRVVRHALTATMSAGSRSPRMRTLVSSADDVPALRVPALAGPPG